tara:strand:+ start:4271 stop:5233 length:963 start_codon:yes stop_codon:yes gene_type:complete
MQFASVMAVVEPQGPKDIDIGSQNSNDQVIFTALELGKRFQAETLLLHVLPPNSDVLMMGPEVGQAGAMSAQASTILQGIEAQITQRQEYFESLYTRHVAAFEPFLNIDAEAEIPGWQPSSFSVRKITPTGHECREIARLGRLADLIVIAAPEHASGGIESAALETALLDTGRPVLLAHNRCRMPGTQHGEKPVPSPAAGGRMVIGWDGSRAAALSIRNALPLLKLAAAVDVVHLATGRERANPRDVAAYLRLHGIKASAHTLSVPDRTIADVLLGITRNYPSSMLVIGADSHDIMADAPFGSVTRDIINTADVPVFLSH